MAREYADQCSAKFTGDTDIGGYGIISSYIAIAGITTIVGLVKILTYPEGLRERFLCWWYGNDREDLFKQAGPPGRWHKIAIGLLRQLSDLQILTSLAIITAGYASRKSMSFYHQNLVVDYWWLNMNSFWVSRDDQSRDEVRDLANGLKWKIKFRQSLLLVSILSAIPYLFMVAFQQENAWDWHSSGQCFRYPLEIPFPLTILWITGLVPYAFEQGLDLFELNKRFCSTINNLVEQGLDLLKLNRRFCSSIKGLVDKPREIERSLICKCHRRATEIRFDQMSDLVPVFKISCLASLALFILMARQFIAIWSFGNSTPVVKAMIYCFYFVLTTLDVVGTKSLNSALLTTGEDWGFGQYVPLVLVLATIYYLVDAFVDALNDDC